MKIVLFLFVLVQSSFGQQKITFRVIDKYLQKLDNNSVVFSTHYGTGVQIDSVGDFLVKHANAYIVKKLIGSLDDKEKVLSSHVVLTKIFQLTPQTSYVLEDISNDSLTIFKFSYNEFTWAKIYSADIDPDRTISFDQMQMKELKNRWSEIVDNPIYRFRIKQ